MPARVTMYRNDGATAEMYAIDAKDAAKRLPEEWSFEPFDRKAIEEARRSRLTIPATTDE